MRRMLLVVGAGALAIAMSGCVVDPFFQRRLQQTQARVELLETRVGFLETARGVTPFPASPVPSGPVPSPWATPAADLPVETTVVRPVAGSGVRPVSRWPGLPFEGRGAIRKLLRGLTNILTGWVELPKRVDETAERSGPGAGFTWGLLRGVGYAFVRTAAGVYDVVTFPAPVPSDYQPVMVPVYVFRCEGA